MDDIIRTSKEVEIRRCAEDFIYFCETYAKVNHPTQGLIPFVLHPYQKRYVEMLQAKRFVVCKKFRQGGFTTLTSLYLMWRSMFKFDELNMVLSRTDREAIEVSKVVYSIYDRLPEWLQTKYTKRNDHLIQFTNGSRLQFHTPEACCGMAVTTIMFDEAAFWKDADKHWKAMWPTLSNGGKAFIVSSTNGTKKGKWFYDLYTDAEKSSNTFQAFKCSYLEHPQYSEPEWAYDMKQRLGARGWRQEVLCEFIDPDTRTNQQKLDEAIQFFDDVTAAEELVEHLNKAGKEKVEDRRSKIRRKMRKHEMDHVNDIVNCTEQPGVDFNFDFPYHEPRAPLSVNPEKPEVYQFKKMSLAEVNAMIEQFIKNNKPVYHAEFENLSIWTTEDMARLWDEVAQLYPEQYTAIANQWKEAVDKKVQKEKEIEDAINDHIQGQMLALAGIVSTEEGKAIIDSGLRGRPDLKIIHKIQSEARYPKNMTLSFTDGFLCVNGVRTVIKEDDVRDLYNGIFSLTGYEQAIDTAVKAITAKLDPLFLVQGE